RQSRSGAEAADAPADAEDCGATDKRQVDVPRAGHVEVAHQHRRLAGEHEPVPKAGDDDRAAHDEGEAGVPGAREVEEVEDLGRVGHAGHDQPESEDEPAGEAVEDERHGYPPMTCRSTKTVTKP